jgi:hypothetical protein
VHNILCKSLEIDETNVDDAIYYLPKILEGYKEYDYSFNMLNILANLQIRR